MVIAQIGFQNYFKRVKKFNDVSRRADVDKQKLCQLIARQVALGKHPPSYDQDEHQKLLNDDNQCVCIHWYWNILQVQRNL